MKSENMWQKILRGLYHYLLFFGLTAVTVSITMSIFVGILSDELGLLLTGDNLNRAAKLTFAAVIVLSLLMTLIDLMRRKLTTEKITRRIADATKEMVKGNFETRISGAASLATDDNLNEIIDCFNKMAEEIGSLETLRTDFAANVSHEMKTPLSVIHNYGTLLQAPTLGDEKRIEYAKGVTESSRRMADMITNILKLNRLENRSIYPKGEDFDLGEQLCDCLLQFENVWESKEIELDNEIAENVTVRADSELLSLVWNNLFSNAFKFTEKGGTVSLKLSFDENFAAVIIADTGCGMSSEVGSHIFEKFYQGDTSHATEGNGLGLALVKRVVDIMKGEITVESTVGEGTVFTVKIPRKQSAY